MTGQARLYDVRYSRYAGSREARWRSVLALAKSSATRALGLRRTAGAKVWPWLLVAAAHLPAIVGIGVPMLFDGAPDPLDLLSYQQLLAFTLPVIIAFAATTLPSLLTRERRDRVLSLYFSTAVSRVEYLLGKLLAALALMSLVTLSPLLVLLAGSVITAEAPLDALREDGTDILLVIAGGLVMAVYYAALGLLAGALTAKRIFAIGGLLAALLVTPVVSGLVADLSGKPAALAGDLATVSLRAAGTILPGAGIDGSEFTGPPSALVWSVVAGAVLLSAAVLAARYLDEDAA